MAGHEKPNRDFQLQVIIRIAAVAFSAWHIFVHTQIGADLLINRWFGCGGDIFGLFMAVFPEYAFKDYGQISLDWGG